MRIRLSSRPRHGQGGGPGGAHPGTCINKEKKKRTILQEGEGEDEGESEGAGEGEGTGACEDEGEALGATALHEASPVFTAIHTHTLHHTIRHLLYTILYRCS